MQAPAFSLPDQDGVLRSLKDYRGQWLVMYFYPRDDTVDCTVEACAFRDENRIISQFGNASVVGINQSSIESHHKFATKNRLGFTLLSDLSGETVKAYGAWKTQRRFGIAYSHVDRKTFIIDPRGRIVKVYKAAGTQGYASEVIQDLQQLQTAKTSRSNTLF